MMHLNNSQLGEREYKYSKQNKVNYASKRFKGKYQEP